MQRYIRTQCAAVLIAGALGGGTIPAWSQDKPANNMEIVHEKLKADKKLIVSKYMELTESEAKRFWPVYEEYQADLQKIHDRMGSLLKSYAAEYRSQSFTDEKAKKLLDEWLTLEQDDAKRRKSYVPKVLKALPAKKSARYLQIENEYRLLLNYDLAATVPLVQ
jgi:predicted DNA-binding WGR domain protein